MFSSLACISLIINDVEHFSKCLLTIYLALFLHVFLPFKNWAYWLVVCVSDKNPFSDLCVIRIFLPIRFLNGYLLMCESFKFFWNLIYQFFFLTGLVFYMSSPKDVAYPEVTKVVFFFSRSCITLAFYGLWSTLN